MKLPVRSGAVAAQCLPNFTMSIPKSLKKFGIVFATLPLSACNYLEAPPATAALSMAQIDQLIPRRVPQSQSFAKDISAIFDTLKIDKTPQNICTTIAIIDQESNFNANPPVANLGASSLKALNNELEEKLGSTLAPYFRNMLKNEPTPDNSFEKQIAKVKTEQALDDIYHEMFTYFTQKYYASNITNVSKLIGGDIEERLDPITTLGSMQVQVSYARDNQRMNGNNLELRKDLYSQYGGLYYGIHRLMRYAADYPEPLYRFADYNSGMYSSRNAAFQKMLHELAKTKIDYDGDLLVYEKGNKISSKPSQSEQALNQLLAQGTIALSARQIRNDLAKEKSQKFEDTETYRTIGSLYQMKTGKKPLKAIMPQVVISGAKLSRDYHTQWYADKVNARYLACLNKAKRY